MSDGKNADKSPPPVLDGYGQQNLPSLHGNVGESNWGEDMASSPHSDDAWGSEENVYLSYISDDPCGFDKAEYFTHGTDEIESSDYPVKAETESSDYPVKAETESSDYPVKANKFTFEVPQEKLKLIPICTNRRGERRFGKGWTELFYKHLHKHNLTCPMVFRTNHVRKDGSRKANTDFFKAHAHCKFDGCVRYSFRIKRDPKDGEPVKVKVSPIKPYNMINHVIGVTKSRFVAGKYRQNVATKTEKQGASNTYYELLGSLDERSLQAGNTTGVGSKQVIQKIASESNLSHRLHKDVMTEVAILKLVYEKEDESDGPVRGYVQALSFYPFAVSLYSNDQINIIATEMSKGGVVLYFDATGKVITKIPGQKKRVLYYALLLKGRGIGDPPIPVAEFITNAHATVDISVFLMRFLKDLQDSLPSPKIPSRVEVDFSWAMIHAVLLSCNRENISTYLKRAWEHLHNKEPWGSNTKIHICSAHVIHKISGRLSKIMKNKSQRRHILYAIARMIDTKTITELEDVFVHLTILLLCEHVTSHSKYAEASSRLKGIISNNTEICEDETTENLEEEVHGATPRTSAFAHHFQGVTQRITDEIKVSTNKQPGEPNPYFCPEASKYLLGTYMGVTPLWTGLLLEDVAHDTNSSVENWMKIVKRDILQGKSRLSPANFIIETRSNLKGRIREYNNLPVTERRGKKVPHRQKPKNDSSSFLSCEEVWGDKKKKKKSVYFREPLTLDCERGLHWGGDIDIDGRTVSVTNTCPVDNLLMLLHYALNNELVAKCFFSNSAKLEVCKVLMEIHDFFLRKQWSKGREVWIKAYYSPPDKDHWDLFGSEFQHFVKHFGSIQESECLSTCSRRRCPQKSRQLVSTEISLGDRTSREFVSLQESLRQWEEQVSSDCQAGPLNNRCKGARTCSSRRFVNENPPVLILNVSYLSEARGFTFSQLPKTVEVTNCRYSVLGCTFGDGSHFKAYFVREGKWYKYDGLCSPEVAFVPSVTESGQMEHIVLLRETD